ncbi:hypothetical protein C8J56DRAFT_1109558 [Mycena floridula]|nr:hypothetical protein C8J56DRAFT_1109558 [Mycena floridula]
MSPEEVALLKHAGQVLMENFSSLTLTAVYVLVASLAMYTLLVRPNKTRATWALCVMLALIFVITTAYFSLFIVFSSKLIIGALIENTEFKLLERLEIANASTLQISLAELWISGNGNSLLSIFGDGIVVWRAWAVWPDQQSVIILPALTLLATFAVFLTLLIMQTITLSAPEFVHGQVAALSIAGAILNIATNLIAIILIGIKTYQHRKCMKDTIGLGNSAAGKVLMFLTESGIIYIVLQIINFCLNDEDNTVTTTLDMATRNWAAFVNFFSAIYPSLVILIVKNQHSIARLTIVSTAGDINPGTHISFAPSPPLQGTIDSSHSTNNQAEAAGQSSAERHLDVEKVTKDQETKYAV